MGNLPTHYPADPLAPNQHNNKVVLQLRNDLSSAINITLPDAAWQRTGNINPLDCATIVGVGGHGAAPPSTALVPVLLGQPSLVMFMSAVPSCCPHKFLLPLC